jgi:hypothetical protein
MYSIKGFSEIVEIRYGKLPIKFVGQLLFPATLFSNKPEGHK